MNTLLIVMGLLAYGALCAAIAYAWRVAARCPYCGRQHPTAESEYFCMHRHYRLDEIDRL